MVKSICVYCGSSEGNDPVMKSAAFELGQVMAKDGLRLVYGGAKIGLMGAVAQGCLEGGGEVLGVIPEFLDSKEISNDEATELIITQTMHERKTIMAEQADAFIALPGGMGTLEEVAEILTWGQLGLIQKPIGFLSVDKYYDHLFELFKHMNAKGLLKDEHLELFVYAETVSDLLDRVLNFKSFNTSFRRKLGLT